MTEVEICGGGHCSRLRSTLMCSRVPPPHVYKGGRGRPAGPHRRAKGGGILLLVGVGLPPFLVLLGKEGGGKRRKEGAPPLPLVQFGLGPWGARGQPLDSLLSLSPLCPISPITSPVVPITLPTLRYLSGDPRNSSGVRITSSNISFFMSRPFRDSSSRP